MALKKIIQVILGSISLFIGILAIFIPGLPTTPFLLLAAWLYLRSSKKLHGKLMANRIIGGYIREFQANKGMTKRTKIQAIGTMWVMILISSIFLIELVYLKIAMILLGVIGTVVMGFIVRTADRPGRDK